MTFAYVYPECLLIPVVCIWVFGLIVFLTYRKHERERRAARIVFVSTSVVLGVVLALCAVIRALVAAFGG